MTKHRLLDLLRHAVALSAGQRLILAGSQAFYALGHSAPDLVERSEEADLLLGGVDRSLFLRLEEVLGMESPHLRETGAKRTLNFFMRCSLTPSAISPRCSPAWSSCAPGPPPTPSRTASPGWLASSATGTATTSPAWLRRSFTTDMTPQPSINSAFRIPHSRILYLFTRTPLHVGAGASVGAIDQPIIRERHTGFPVVPGTSLKGVLRDTATRDDKIKADVDAIFGEGFGSGSKEFSAGRVSFGEAKLLAFPVRSAKGSFAFAACPLALERFQREHGGLDTLKVPAEPKDMECLAGDTVTIARNGQTGVVLEEYRFNRAPGDAGTFPGEWEAALLGLLDDPVWQAGKGRFLLLSNGDFSHFVKNACEVSQHVGIDPQKGTAKPGALFNLEAVPAEALFFASITPLARASDELDKLAELFARRPLLQFGGDGTTGLGFCTVKLS